MKGKTYKFRLLAVAMMLTTSIISMAQKTPDETDWLKDFTSRITLNGYAQAGWSYQNPNGKDQNS